MVGKDASTGRGYYVRLEVRLDPVERVLKAMDLADRYVDFPFRLIGYSAQARKHFFARLRRQRAKHLFWFAVDLVLSIAVTGYRISSGPEPCRLVSIPPFAEPLSRFLRDSRRPAFPQRYV